MNNLTILFTDHIFVLVTNSFTGPFCPFSLRIFIRQGMMWKAWRTRLQSYI